MNLGTHVIFDVVLSEGLCICTTQRLVEEACIEAGATVIESKYHEFGNLGFTGVTLLQESHASVHYWPEYKTATFDIYMCGECDPTKAAKIILLNLPVVGLNLQTLKRNVP